MTRLQVKSSSSLGWHTQLVPEEGEVGVLGFKFSVFLGRPLLALSLVNCPPLCTNPGGQGTLARVGGRPSERVSTPLSDPQLGVGSRWLGERDGEKQDWENLWPGAVWSMLEEGGGPAGRGGGPKHRQVECPDLGHRARPKGKA